MKEKRICYFRSKVFRNFLYSYIGVFLLTLSLLSYIGVNHIVENLKLENERITRNKLYTIGEDLKNQLENMRSVAVETACLPTFHLEYFKTNKYHEIELLDALKVYKHSSDICEQYFLKYNEVHNIYTSSGTTIPLSVYYANEFGKEGYDELEEEMETVGRKADQKVTLYKNGEKILFIYPLKRYAPSKLGREAVLCFLADESNLMKRIENIVGNMNGRFTICYQDFCILGNDKEVAKNALEWVSLDECIRIYYEMDEESYISYGKIFSISEAVIYGGVILLLLIAGFFAAWGNYRPMKKITEKYEDVVESGLSADWEGIDTLIESLLHGESRNIELLQKQYQIMKEQLVYLITLGEYSDKVQEHMTLLGIKIEALVYGVYQCRLAGEEEIPKDERKQEEKQGGRQNKGDNADDSSLCKDIEGLSDDTVSVLACRDSDRSLRVLVAAEEEYQIEEVAELLHSLFEAKDREVVLEMTGVFKDLKEIGSKPATGKQNRKTRAGRIMEGGTVKKGQTEEGQKRDGGREERSANAAAPTRENPIARQALAYIEENCTNYELSLEHVAERFGITSTYMCRLIKQQTGTSYKEYLVDLRIQKAKEMLKDREISVAEVCQRTGYNNVSHFIRVFQKNTGMTPARYRDEHLEMF